MKSIHTLISYLSVFFLSILLSGCTADINELHFSTIGAAGSAMENTCKLTLNVDYPAFLNDSGTRAKNGRWEEGDQIFLCFSSNTYGVGTYTDYEWQFTYIGKLDNTQKAQCAAYFLNGGNISADNDQPAITFDGKTAIYGTETGSYSYSNQTLEVTCTLLPLTSRMHFKGKIGDSVTLFPADGLKCYTKLNYAQKELTASDIAETTLTINDDGFTDYVYVLAGSDIQLQFSDQNNKIYEQKIPLSKFTTGASGVLTLTSGGNSGGGIFSSFPFVDNVEHGEMLINGWGGDMTKTVEEKDGNHYYVIEQPALTTNFWDVQLAYDIDYTFINGTTYYLEMDIKGSVPGRIQHTGLQNEKNNYAECANFGAVEISTEWQHIKQSAVCTGDGAQRIVISIGDYLGTLYLDNIKVYQDVPAEERYIYCISADMVSDPWDSQLMILIDQRLNAGNNYEFSMDVKADQGTLIGWQLHNDPGNFLYWGDYVGFNTEWSTFYASGEVPLEADHANCIALNLNDFASANTYYFKNISFKVNGRETVVNGDLSTDELDAFIYEYDRGPLTIPYTNFNK